VLDVGDIVPADARMLDTEEAALQIDQSYITGESKAVRKHAGDELYYMSVVKRGYARAIVVDTGDHTFIGRAARLLASIEPGSRLVQILGQMATFMVRATFIALFTALVVTIFRGQGLNRQNFLGFFMLANYIAQTKTVVTITMAVGAHTLARKKAIVSRLHAIEYASPYV
jgi:H+-transporting ATPase